MYCMAAPLDAGAGERDQNLLFAVLALIESVIDRDQFARAYSEWISRKDAEFADILAEKGWLRPDDRLKVEQAMRRHRSRYVEETQSTLADGEAIAGDPKPETLGFVAAAPDETTDVPLGGSRGQEFCGLGVPNTQRYKFVRLHGEGGVGRVWLVRDERLGREVALKELNPSKARDPSALTRFIDEARVTGQLQHPGIAPVYELSQHQPEGRPFYTMRFLRGKTLTQAVEDFHRRRLAGSSLPVELRELLGAFLSVCQVIAYAHSLGVLHRDLKGQNVVIGDFGEAMVVDWGLAKVVSEDMRGADRAESPSPARSHFV